MGAMSPFFCSSKSLSSAKGKVALALSNHVQRELRRCFALRVKMPSKRGRRVLGAGGAILEDETASNREGSAGSGK